MGNGACSKPWKNTDPSVLGAYYFDENECLCGSNTYKIAEEPNKEGWPKARQIIEAGLDEAAEITIEYATRSCCCDSLRFGEVIAELQKSWMPGINDKIKDYGFIIEPYTWSEWQYNGQSSRKKYFLVLRIKAVAE